MIKNEGYSTQLSMYANLSGQKNNYGIAVKRTNFTSSYVASLAYKNVPVTTYINLITFIIINNYKQIIINIYRSPTSFLPTFPKTRERQFPKLNLKTYFR